MPTPNPSEAVRLRYAERVHDSVPNSELVVLERSSHWVFVDAMEQVRTHVVAFLARVAASR